MRAAQRLGAGALLASAASAVLIPSTASFGHLSSPVTSLGLLDPSSRLLKIDCAGCHSAHQAVSSEDAAPAAAAAAITWVKGIDMALVLNISVGNDASTLELNGVRFYPPVLSLTTESAVPYIPQIPASLPMTKVRADMEELQASALRLTGWAFQADRVQAVSESGEELLTLHLQLHALERQPVSVPDVKVTALKNTQGELMIVNVEAAERKKPAQLGCESWPLLCSWKDMLGAKLHGFGSFRPAMFGARKPCHSRFRGHPRPDGQHGWKLPATGMRHGGVGAETNIEPDELMALPVPMPVPQNGHWPPAPPLMEHGPPPPGWAHGPAFPHSGPPHMHHRHHRLRRFMHILARTALTVVIPVLLGVVAGMLTYLLGVALGAVATVVYMRLRGRRARYAAVALEEGESESKSQGRRSMDKDGLIGDEMNNGDHEPLPVYVEKE